ncbi:DUF6461 domain-containing protein [Dactylosporangium sp. NPDC050688]|uniref:DUF6461 domain-containing protein n=1 Tax=Dactylosporangium sp. NPDC050688 TaxID=3157217 RepID=UPI0033DABC2A
MVDVPDAVVVELTGPVGVAVPLLASRTPVAPAAELGRLRAVAEGPRTPGLAGRPAAAGFRSSGERRGEGDSPVLDALRSLPELLTQRLLGALELTVAELDLAAVPDLSGLLGAPFTGRFAVTRLGRESEAVTGAVMLDRTWPGALPLVAALARRLAAHPDVAARLTVDPGLADEPGVAAAHGAAHLALGVATAAAVLHLVGSGEWAVEPPAVLGAGIGAAVLLLREAPMPAGYAAAVLARARAEYRLPVHAGQSALVSEHRFALLEGGGVPAVDFAGNGLVAVVLGGAVIRTGVESGHVSTTLRVLDGPPAGVAAGWEEIIEVSWRSGGTGAAVLGSGAGAPDLRRCTPPWPGDYRLRVHARGRDDLEERGSESYELVVWQAPAAPEVVYARTDRLGHRLRGEAEPVRPELPEAAYRWVRGSSLGEAATVTVVTGSDVAEVLRAFGADPGRPESARAVVEDLSRRRSVDPWVAVLDAGDAVLAVEWNGWTGSTVPVLVRASAGGRAASMFWNVNAATRLTFAERGDLLLAVEPAGDFAVPPALAVTFAGLDFADRNRSRWHMGLAAVQRFTGHGFTAEHLARIEAADVAFRIVPDLPPLYPNRHPRRADPLGAATGTLAGLPEPRLRELAWWAVAEAARYAGLSDDPDIAASLSARALTPDAVVRARRSQLDGGEHRALWLALHRATNPDPVTAVIETVDAARYIAGPHAANLIADARARIAG